MAMVTECVPIPDAVTGSSVDVVVVNVLVVMGVGVDSTGVLREWVKGGAEGTLLVPVLPVLLAETDVA